MPKKIYAHELVAEVARGLAAAVYEECAKSNPWYQANPSQAIFVERTYGQLLTQARQIMGQMLAPTSLVPEAQKAQIAEALMLDAQLPQRGGRGLYH